MQVNGKTHRARNPANVIRDAEFVLLYRDGKTLHEIGAQYGVSREYVRQQLAKLGMTKIDGGASLRTLRNTGAKVDALRAMAAKKEARTFGKWGMSCEQLKEICSLPRSHPKHPLTAYRYQRRNSVTRGIPWEISFAEWWRIWQESGHWHERGRGKGYCMARWADDGPYSVENVYICTVGQNFSDSYITKPWRDRFPNGHPVNRRGANPAARGYAKNGKKWEVYASGKRLGRVDTEQEAIEIRRAHIASQNLLPPATPSGGSAQSN